MPGILFAALGRIVGRPLYSCVQIIGNHTVLAVHKIVQMIPALHAKAPARGLGWMRRGPHGLKANPSLSTSRALPMAQELASDVEAVIKSIHANKTKAVVYVTGGAVQSISWLLSVPGASATVLEASVPYARDSLVDVLGKEPEQYCSPATAAALAAAAYRRAANLSGFGASIVGVGATCALATVPLKRGAHRAYVAIHGSGGSRVAGLQLAKGARSRAGEDELASRLLVKLLADATGADSSPLQLPLLHPPPHLEAPAANPPTPCREAAPTASSSHAGTSAVHPQPASVPPYDILSYDVSENDGNDSSSSSSGRGSDSTSWRLLTAPPVPSTRAAATTTPPSVVVDATDAHPSSGPVPSSRDPLLRLLAGEVRCVEYCGAEVVVDAPRRGRVYLPGSFNPLHEGHLKLLAAAVRAASSHGGQPLEGAFELTVQNADKGLLAEQEIRRRVSQFVSAGLPLLVTRAPLFTDKAGLLQGARFVVGYDTAVRLVLPKYYGDSNTQMLLDFARLRHQGCRFLVAGRRDPASGRFLGLADVALPPELADLFPTALPEEAFRMDISSTEIRQRQQQQQQQQEKQQEREKQEQEREKQER